MLPDFVKSRKDIIVPIALLIISLGVLAFNSFTRSEYRINPFSRLVLAIISYPQRWVNGIVGGMGHVWKHYVDLRGARLENDVLHRQMDDLQMRLQVLSEELERTRMSVSAPAFDGAQFVTAQIIGLSPQEEYRVMTINVGAASGVRYGMPVITGAGVAGKIIGGGGGRTVPPTSATVLLLTDPRCRVDALIYRFNPPLKTPNAQEPVAAPPEPKCPWDPANWQQTRIRGVVQGAQDKLILKFVPRDADVRLGDRVVSSGLGGVFPKGLLLGTISRVVPPEVGLSPYIEVAPAVNFQTLEEVKVMIQKGNPAP
jgi:rod shape-determining protein MreC